MTKSDKVGGDGGWGGSEQDLNNVALEVHERSVERKETNHFVTIVVVVADVPVMR